MRPPPPSSDVASPGGRRRAAAAGDGDDDGDRDAGLFGRRRTPKERRRASHDSRTRRDRHGHKSKLKSSFIADNGVPHGAELTELMASKLPSRLFNVANDGEGDAASVGSFSKSKPPPPEHWRAASDARSANSTLLEKLLSGDRQETERSNKARSAYSYGSSTIDSPAGGNGGGKKRTGPSPKRIASSESLGTYSSRASSYTFWSGSSAGWDYLSVGGTSEGESLRSGEGLASKLWGRASNANLNPKKLRRWARVAAAAVTLGVVCGTAIYRYWVAEEGYYRSLFSISNEGGVPDYGVRADDVQVDEVRVDGVDGSQEREVGPDQQLRFRSLPQGGSIVEMVPAASGLASEDARPRREDAVKKDVEANNKSYESKQKTLAEISLREKNLAEHLEKWKDY